MELQIKKALTNVIIAGLQFENGELTLFKQGDRRNTKIPLSTLTGKYKSISAVSSFDIGSSSVGTWMNSEDLPPSLAIRQPDYVPPEPTDLTKFLGRTILSVGVYEGKEGRNKKITISLRTGIPTPPDPNKPNQKPKPPKIETLAIGVILGK